MNVVYAHRGYKCIFLAPRIKIETSLDFILFYFIDIEPFIHYSIHVILACETVRQQTVDGHLTTVPLRAKVSNVLLDREISHPMRFHGQG